MGPPCGRTTSGKPVGLRPGGRVSTASIFMPSAAAYSILLVGPTSTGRTLG